MESGITSTGGRPRLRLISCVRSYYPYSLFPRIYREYSILSLTKFKVRLTVIPAKAVGLASQQARISAMPSRYGDYVMPPCRLAQIVDCFGM